LDAAIADWTEAIRLSPREAKFHGSRGYAWYAKQDYDKAIADYDTALRLDPNNFGVYCDRALARFDKGDVEKAIADYSEALRLDPKDAIAYNERGFAWESQGDNAKAMADYDAALRLNPTYAVARVNRGMLLEKTGEDDQAMAEFNVAVRDDPKNAYGWLNLGILHFRSRKPVAADECRQVIEIQGWKGNLAACAVAVGYFSSRLANDEPRARAFLTDSAGKLAEKWPAPAIKFLRGELTEQELLALATDDDKRTEARCYLGLHHLAGGKPDDARLHFEWIQKHGTKGYFEHGIALAELKRLRK
jgi:tetratricopeptide (TPR) repeat protein